MEVADLSLSATFVQDGGKDETGRNLKEPFWFRPCAWGHTFIETRIGWNWLEGHEPNFKIDRRKPQFCA
jgi:hypothetical protein